MKMKMKMKTIKRKIMTPFVLLVVLVPIVTLLIFNVALQLYVKKVDSTNMLSAILPIETLARQEFADSAATTNEGRLQIAVQKLILALQSSKLSDAKLLIYNNNGLLAYPKTLPDGFITENLTKRIEKRLAYTNLSGKAQRLRTASGSCLITGYEMTGAAGNHITLVLVSREDSTRGLVGMVNIILLVTMGVGIGIGVFITGRVSGHMSRHAKTICTVTEHIGNGDFKTPVWGKTDIAEFDELCRSITRMVQLLEASEDSRRRFLQNASHELRTPLMSIQGYAEGISIGVVTDVSAAAQIITDESQRLNALVSELLALTKIEGSASGLQTDKVELGNVLKEFTDRLGGIAVKQNKKIDILLPGDLVTVDSNEEMLEHAITNIVSNCLRYAKTKVVVTLLHEDQTVIIRVTDDGDGISESDLSHLFERFYKGKSGNFGLGLAIAKSAIDNIGGQIKAYNSESGAVFDIILPLRPNH